MLKFRFSHIPNLHVFGAPYYTTDSQLHGRHTRIVPINYGRRFPLVSVAVFVSHWSRRVSC
jgi:hypothetical protein